MESAMAFAWCVFTLLLSTTLTGGNVIPREANNSVEIGNTSLLTQLLDAVRLPSATASPGDSGTVLVMGGGPHQAGEAGQRDSRRSAPGDSNLSNAPAAFAIAEDLSGAQLAEILQGLTGSVPAGVGCSDESNTVAPTAYSEYTSDICYPGVIPAVDDAKISTRGLCPWTYVEHTDVDRYPSTLLYAQCACADCVRQTVSDDYGCHPIYHDVKVLRKHACQDGIQIYESVYERVPVACACLRTL